VSSKPTPKVNKEAISAERPAWVHLLQLLSPENKEKSQ
jgi:hypothetical protein